MEFSSSITVTSNRNKFPSSITIISDRNRIFPINNSYRQRKKKKKETKTNLIFIQFFEKFSLHFEINIINANDKQVSIIYKNFCNNCYFWFSLIRSISLMKYNSPCKRNSSISLIFQFEGYIHT